MNIPGIALKIKHLDRKSFEKLLVGLPDILIPIFLVITGFFVGFSASSYLTQGKKSQNTPISYELPDKPNSTIPPLTQKEKGSVTASKTGSVYYLPSCASSRIKPENILTFSTEAQAQAAGYQLSKTCIPK